MKKLLCCVLAALLAVLPCCGVASVSIFEHLISNVLCSRHLLQISDYSKSIPEYVKWITENQNCKMIHIEELDSENQCYYQLFLDSEYVYVAFMGDRNELQSIVFLCDIDQEAKHNKAYYKLVSALPLLCLSTIETNGGNVSIEQKADANTQIVKYFLEGGSDSSFIYSNDRFLLDVFYKPKEGVTTEGTICIWFDIA